MNLLILGATGPTGRHNVVAGDATSHNDVAKAMIGQDVVISALGRSTSVRADDLFTRAAAASPKQFAAVTWNSRSSRPDQVDELAVPHSA